MFLLCTTLAATGLGRERAVLVTGDMNEGEVKERTVSDDRRADMSEQKQKESSVLSLQAMAGQAWF